MRGHNLFKGYLGRADASAAAVVDGWFRTGDLGTYADGILTIVDRKKDMIVRSGYNVYPTEVEAVLARHPGIALAAVFGVADDVRGQEVHAAVVAARGRRRRPGRGRRVREATASPRTSTRASSTSSPSLPLGSSGKVLKRELVAQFSPVR